MESEVKDLYSRVRQAFRVPSSIAHNYARTRYNLSNLADNLGYEGGQLNLWHDVKNLNNYMALEIVKQIAHTDYGNNMVAIDEPSEIGTIIKVTDDISHDSLAKQPYIVKFGGELLDLTPESLLKNKGIKINAESILSKLYQNESITDVQGIQVLGIRYTLRDFRNTQYANAVQFLDALNEHNRIHEGFDTESLHDLAVKAHSEFEQSSRPNSDLPFFDFVSYGTSTLFDTAERERTLGKLEMRRLIALTHVATWGFNSGLDKIDEDITFNKKILDSKRKGEKMALFFFQDVNPERELYKLQYIKHNILQEENWIADNVMDFINWT